MPAKDHHIRSAIITNDETHKSNGLDQKLSNEHENQYDPMQSALHSDSTF
jgi:hypothetical protein